MIKKKSKSIDNFQKYKSSSISKLGGSNLKKNKNSSNKNNNSMINTVGIKSDEKIISNSMVKPIYKKSLDLSYEELN
jgi:hypothetical protein